MAAPKEVTIKNLTGRWVMDKNKSDPSDAVLSTQGVGWVTRKAIGVATIYLQIKQTVDDNGVTHINIDQTATGGISGTSEKRELDWELRTHSDHVFGKVSGRNRWISLDKVSEPLPDYESTPDEVKYLTEGWLTDDSEIGGPNGEKNIDSFVVNEERKWTARQIWGFALIDGQRHYVRRAVVKKIGAKDKDKDTHHVRLVYNWQPE